MREIHDHADAVIEGDTQMIFETITDIDHLPEWNGAIEQVTERPAGLTAGATWTVEMHPARGALEEHLYAPSARRRAHAFQIPHSQR